MVSSAPKIMSQDRRRRMETAAMLSKVSTERIAYDVCLHVDNPQHASFRWLCVHAFATCYM